MPVYRVPEEALDAARDALRRSKARVVSWRFVEEYGRLYALVETDGEVAGLEEYRVA